MWKRSRTNDAYNEDSGFRKHPYPSQVWGDRLLRRVSNVPAHEKHEKSFPSASGTRRRKVSRCWNCCFPTARHSFLGMLLPAVRSNLCAEQKTRSTLFVATSRLGAWRRSFVRPKTVALTPTIMMYAVR